MTESPDTAVQSTNVAEPPRYRDPDQGDRRLRRTLTWVGIVAGVVFIVAVIFFSGMALGRGFGVYHGWHRGYQGGQGGCLMNPGGMNGGMMGPGGMMGGMMGPGGRMDPEDMGPGMMRPGMMRPGMMRPGQSPAPSSAPASPTPR